MKKILAWIKRNILGLEPPKRKKKKSTKVRSSKKTLPKKNVLVKSPAKKTVLIKKKLEPIPVNKKKFKDNSADLLEVSKNYLKKSNDSLNSAGKAIGVITHFFPHVSAAIIKINQGTISVGESIRFKGEHTDFKITVKSMQMNRAPIEIAKKGQEIGIQVPERVREGDEVFKLIKSSPGSK